MLPTDATQRKAIPVFTGFVNYFPRAMAAVATVSKLGNDQHNPGEPLHWSRGKSNDHRDCLMRHLMGVGTPDDDGQLHAAKLAWRAMAILELELEDIAAADASDGQAIIDRASEDVVPFDQMRDEIMSATEVIIRENDRRHDPVMVPLVEDMGDMPTPHISHADIADRIVFSPPKRCCTHYPTFDPPNMNVKVVGIETGNPKCYLGGGMTGHDKLNFPAFDEHKGYLENLGYDVISPADLDRAAGIDENDYRLGNMPPPLSDMQMRAILDRDIQAILSLRPDKDAIAFIPGWEKSTGAAAEFFFARWWGLDVIDAVHGMALGPMDVDFHAIKMSMREYLRERSA